MRKVLFMTVLVATALSVTSAKNPIITNRGVNDPHIHIFNGKAYLYATHDRSIKSKRFAMDDWWIWSSDDLVNWKLESVLQPEQTYIGDPDFDQCWATDAATRNGKYYWYLSEGNHQAGVVVGDSPIGPWKDPLGKPLLAEDLTPTHEYDMSIFLDDDGRHHILFGVWDYYMAPLADDMISLAAAPKKIVINNPQGPYGDKTDDKPSLHKYNGKYYLSWGAFYAMSDDLYGPYDYVGTILNDDSFAPGYSEPTWPHGYLQGRHGRYFTWHSQWYYAYCDMSQTGNRRFRDTFISYVHYKKDGTIAPIRVDGIGVGEYDAGQPRIEAEDYFRAEGMSKVEIADNAFAIVNEAKTATVCYPNIDRLVQQGVIEFQVACNHRRGAELAVHANGPQGRRLGHGKIPYTGKGKYISLACDLKDLHGVTGLCLVVNAKQAQAVSLDAFRFQRRKQVSDRVQKLIDQMTLTEKVSQVRVFHSNLGIELDEHSKLEMSEKVRDKLQHGIAGIKNPGTEMAPAEGMELCNQLQRYVIENNRLGIPALFITECYSGVDAVENTFLARPITMASTWNPDLVQQAWDVVGAEARARGMHLCHSPEGDLARDPRFGRMSETFGEDTHLVSRMITAAVRGVQGNGMGLKATHIGACAKHYAGYPQVEGGRNFASVQISPRSFIDEILPPFKAAVQEGGCLGIMASHADINGEASHANRHLLTEILREQWGFDGYVISDSHDIERLHFFMGVAESFEDAAILALTAGLDIDLYGDQGYAFMEDIINKKPELLPVLDQAVARVLMTKEKLGLFDNPYYDVDQTKAVTRSQLFLDRALAVDREAITLLKNEKQLLPLHLHKAKSFAVIGPLVDGQQVEAIRMAAGRGASVSYARGCGITQEGKPSAIATPEQDAPLIKEAIALAKKSDVVIAFLGGNEYTSKEAYFKAGIGDRDCLDPVGQQNELMEKLKATGKPIVLVLKHRRTLSFVTLDACATAVLDCWELSERGHEAIAEVLFGKVNPSGKLPVTVPRSVGQLPAYYSQKNINFKKGYLFTKSTPLYLFGHGLSYTSFAYDNLKIENRGTAQKVDVTISLNVTNTGDLSGKEVCQLYVRDVIGSVTRPAKVLKGFAKVELKPGQTRTVRFKLDTEDLSFTGLDMKFDVEPGDFEVLVGPSSQKGLVGNFRLD